MTRRSSRLRKHLAAAALTITCPAAVAQPPSERDDATDLRIYGNTTTIELAPVWLAVEHHYDGSASVTNGGIPNLFGVAARTDLMEAGYADIATNADTQALRNSVAHPDLRIIMTVTEGFYRLVARRSAGIEKLEDLRGKRIGTVPPTSSGYYLHRMLAEAGLTEADVAVVPLWPMERYRSALENDEVDAVTVWEPGPEHAMEVLGDDGIVFQNRSVYRELFNLNTTAANLEDPAMRAKIVDFVAALLIATDEIHRDPSRAITLLSVRTGLDPELIETVWPEHGFPGGIVPDLLDVLEQEEVWLAGREERTPRSREELAALIDTSVLREAEQKLAEAGHPAALRRLERRVAALDARTAQSEAMRAVKRLQHAYGHYAEFGMWDDLAELFGEDAVARFGDAQELNGRDAIRAHLIDTAGNGRAGLAEGRLNTHLIMSPVVTLDPSGVHARGRWHLLALLADGDGATWAGGIYENEYVLEDGAWKIAKLDYHAQYEGPYETGWRNVKEERPDDVRPVPFHYDADGAGLPVTPLDERALAAPAPPGADGGLDALGARLAAIERRIADLQDEALVRNLQHAYGYYVDRQMWDDVAELFTEDATFEVGARGAYIGKTRIRAALEELGAEGLEPGELNDHLQLQTIVTIAPSGVRAAARGLELAMTGKHGVGGELGVGVFENRFVKDGGVWKIEAMRVFPRMLADYAAGWAAGAKALAGPSERLPPDRSSSPTAVFPEIAVPAFHFTHPVSGRPPRYPENMPRIEIETLAPSSGARAVGAPPRTLGALSARLDEAERRLAVVRAYDGAENISNAYGYYIDEFLWHDMADVFSVNGWKELSYIGTYVGRDRIRESVIRRYSTVGRRPNALVIHQKTQPVVHVAGDGRSAKIRTRLFQMNSSYANPGSWLAGIYENEVVLENGLWKISAMDLDYTWTAGYDVGWAGVESAAARRFAPTSGGLAEEYPPDRPLRGAIFPPYPDVLEMRFHYANPVSGRAAER